MLAAAEKQKNPRTTGLYPAGSTGSLGHCVGPDDSHNPLLWLIIVNNENESDWNGNDDHDDDGHEDDAIKANPRYSPLRR